MAESNGLGMDHRAIVWCHNALAKVRQIIHIMVVQEDPMERQRQLASLLPERDYSAALIQQREIFRVSVEKS